MTFMKPKADCPERGDILYENFSTVALIMKVKNSNRSMK